MGARLPTRSARYGGIIRGAWPRGPRGNQPEGEWVTTEGVVARGNLAPDAHLATLLRQHRVRRLYTSDADFREFPFLEVRDAFS